MKIMRIAFCLFLIAYLFGCSGDPTQTGGAGRGAAKVLADDLQITSDPNDQTQPSVAYDTVNKRYLVVWTDFRNVNLSCSGTVCGTDIFGKLCTGTGTGTETTMTCGSEFLISNITGSPVSGNQSQPKAAYDVQNKKYLVVWTDSRNAGYTQIFGQYVNPDGTSNGNNTAITPHDTSGGPNNPQYLSQSEPSLAYNETTKNFDIAWLDNTDSDSVNTVTIKPCDCSNAETIAYVPLQFGADTNMIRTGEINGANPLTTAINIRDYTKLVFTKTSGFIASCPTGPITASLETQVDETHPSIFYNKATGENFAAWQGRTNSVDFSQKFTPTAQIGTQTVVVQPPTHTIALCGGATNKCWLAGDPVSATFTHPLTTTPTYFLADNSAVTGINLPPPDAITGGTVVTGILTADSNAVDQTGTNFTKGITVVGTVSLGTVCSYDAATWTVTDKDAGIQKIKVRQPTGTSQTGTLFKDLTFGTGNSFNPAITTDPNTQRALLVWEEQTAATGKDINGFLIDLTNFTPNSSQISVSKAPGDQTSPAVSFDNVNQRFLVVWEDARNQSANISNIDIFSQFIDPQGNLSGANAPVTVAPGNQLAPALAFGDVDFRKFFVVWADGRQPSNADIFGQLMEFSLSPQLLITDATGNPGTPGIPIFSSAIDFGSFPIGLDTNNVLSSITKTFRICNQGNTPLTINSMTPPDAPFSLTTPVPVTISPNVCADMTVMFAPIASGSFAGNSSNNFKTTIDSNGGKVTLYFSGIGTGTQTLRVLTPNLPPGDTLTAYNESLLAFGGVFPFTWSVTAGSLPPGMTLDPASGHISGQPTASGSFTFTVRVTDNNGNTATRQLTINVSVLTITNVNTTLKQWTVGQEYGNAPVEQITAAGGATPYTWSISGGNLPNGLSIDPSTGRIFGVPSQSGQFLFTVKVTESGGQIATKSFIISINSAPSIQTTSLPAGRSGIAYQQTLQEVGGTPTIAWAIGSGSLPPGLSIDTATGIISGTPTSESKNSFTITATDAAGASVSKDLSIEVTTAGGGGGGAASNSGGGCSIGRKQKGPTQVADALVMLTPLFAIIALRNIRRKKK